MAELLPRFHRHLQQAEDERRLARILLETGETLSAQVTAAGSTAAGDARRLRGLPAVGRGVSGAIAGTRPGDSLMRRGDGYR